MTNTPPRLHGERGIALLLTLMLTLALSVLAAAFLTLAQTETYATMNYRTMTQARYAAEAGIHRSANFLLTGYTPPCATCTDALSSYDLTQSPVRYNNQPVVLSSDPNVASNYPVNAVSTAFAALAGTLAVGNHDVSYRAVATLVSMQSFVQNNQVTPTTVQTWRIDGTGMVPGSRVATIQVSAILDQPVNRSISYTYAAFATATGCGALTVGSSYVDSYDSSQWTSGTPTISNSGGNVGTNGNLNANNSARVYGTVSTPRVGVGSCSAGNVTAETASGGAQVTGGVNHLSQPVTEPTPALPNPLPPPGQNINVTDVSSCPAAVPGCTRSGTAKTFPPGTYGNINLTDTARLHLQAGTYNLNSLVVDNASQIILDSGPVIINIVGKNTSGGDLAQPFWLNSSVAMATSNPYDPHNLQILYAGTGTVRFDNAATNVGQVNAPNAAVIVNSSNFYGSIIGSTVTLGNNGRLHFDRNLDNSGPATYVVGPEMLSSFTWKKA